MATEGEEVAVNVPAKTNESRALEEHSTLPNGSPSIVADVLSKKGLNAATSVNQAMKELSQKTDGLKVQKSGLCLKATRQCLLKTAQVILNISGMVSS